MAFFFVPDNVVITFTVSPELLAVLNRWLDTQTDPAAAAELSKAVRASTANLKAALPQT